MAPSSPEIFSKPRATKPDSEVHGQPGAARQHPRQADAIRTESGAGVENTMALTNGSGVSTIGQNEDACAAWIYTLLNVLPIRLYIAATLGVPLWFYMQYRFQGGGDTNLEVQMGHTIEAQWKQVFKRITRTWTRAMVGNAVMLPAAITFLQLDDISKSILGRTFTIAALIVAGVGLFWSWASISGKSCFGAGHVRNRWLEASTGLTTFRFVEFWMTMVAPLACMIWAIIFVAFTVGVLIWTKGAAAGPLDGTSAEPYTQAAMVASAIFLTGLLLALLGLMYRAYKMVNDNGVIVGKERGLCRAKAAEA